jgi:hypothetical protein
MSAPATPAPTAKTTPAAAPASALFLRTGFVDDEIAAAEVLAVHGIDGAISFFVIGDFDESETARLTGETITNEINSRGIDTSLREMLVQGILRRGKRKIANVKLLHLRTPSARNRTACRGAR